MTRLTENSATLITEECRVVFSAQLQYAICALKGTVFLLLEVLLSF